MTPLRAIWATTLISILPGLLDLASPIAANAIFSLTTIALDLSYIIPIFLRRVFRNHPEVMFKPGPFYMGDGFLGWMCNCTCICWTLFTCVILSLPTIRPVTALNMNYASVCITISRILILYKQYVLTLRFFVYLGYYRGSSHTSIVCFPLCENLCNVIDDHDGLFSTWYILGAHKHYHGPQSNLQRAKSAAEEIDHTTDIKEKNESV